MLRHTVNHNRMLEQMITNEQMTGYVLGAGLFLLLCCFFVYISCRRDNAATAGDQIALSQIGTVRQETPAVQPKAADDFSHTTDEKTREALRTKQSKSSVFGTAPRGRSKVDGRFAGVVVDEVARRESFGKITTKAYKA